MTAFASSDEVFAHLQDQFGLDEDGDISALALFAYAIVERDRVHWANHIEGLNGVRPSADDVAAWFRAKPPQYFTEIRQTAIDWYAEFGREMLGDEIEAERQAAVRDAIGGLGRFWPGFWSGNLIGITSNIAFTALVLLFVAVTVTDFSFIAWAKRIFGPH